jgi:hypothetical protein
MPKGAAEILPYQPMFILYKYELTMNLGDSENRSLYNFEKLNVMNVVNFGDIKTPAWTVSFGIILVKIRTFAIGGFHAVYPR